MDCPKCGQEKAITHPIYGIFQGENCVNTDRHRVANLSAPAEFITLSMSSRIQDQREKYEKDLIQPWNSKGKPNIDFIKNYKQLSTEYFTKDEISQAYEE